MATPEPENQLRLLCLALNEARVVYVVFGSHAGRLHGAPLESDDVDLVPDDDQENLTRLCGALNGLRPRWRVPGFPEGVKIDGRRLEPRHFQADSAAVGLVTTIGNIDIVLQRRGFESGYPALSLHSVTMTVGGVKVRVGSLDDLITTKRLHRRPKDLDQLPALEELRNRFEEQPGVHPSEAGREPPDLAS
ncbi:MAG: hypothetical protein ACT4OM_09235 [Actinomycetota bacterium]